MHTSSFLVSYFSEGGDSACSHEILPAADDGWMAGSKKKKTHLPEMLTRFSLLIMGTPKQQFLYGHERLGNLFDDC